MRSRLLERAFTNSAARLKQGQAQYTIMCAEDGGTIDDLIVYRLGPERYMLCVNASNIDVDREWIVELNGGRAKFEDVSDATALIAVQGPVAVAILATLADFPIADVPRFGVASGRVAGITCLAARTGYTGEDGFELFVDNAGARRIVRGDSRRRRRRRCEAVSDSARAIRCGSKRACRSTATNSIAIRRRSKRAWRHS